MEVGILGRFELLDITAVTVPSEHAEGLPLRQVARQQGPGAVRRRRGEFDRLQRRVQDFGLAAVEVDSLIDIRAGQAPPQISVGGIPDRPVRAFGPGAECAAITGIKDAVVALHGCPDPLAVRHDGAFDTHCRLRSAQPGRFGSGDGQSGSQERLIAPELDGAASLRRPGEGLERPCYVDRVADHARIKEDRRRRRDHVGGRPTRDVALTAGVTDPVQPFDHIVIGHAVVQRFIEVRR